MTLSDLHGLFRSVYGHGKPPDNCFVMLCLPVMPSVNKIKIHGFYNIYFILFHIYFMSRLINGGWLQRLTYLGGSGQSVDEVFRAG